MPSTPIFASARMLSHGKVPSMYFIQFGLNMSCESSRTVFTIARGSWFSWKLRDMKAPVELGDRAAGPVDHGSRVLQEMLIAFANQIFEAAHVLFHRGRGGIAVARAAGF